MEIYIRRASLRIVVFFLLCLLSRVVGISNHNFSMTHPRLFIIGAPKCATTSLSDLFQTHEEICASKFKEPQYFNHFWDREESFYRNRIIKNSKCQNQYLDATPDYFHSIDTPHRMLEAWGPEEIKKKRLLLVLRNPIDREFSWYNHLLKGCVPTLRKFLKKKGGLSQSLAGSDIIRACDANKKCSSLCFNTTGKVMGVNKEIHGLNSFEEYATANKTYGVRSDYANNLSNWLKVFKREQILVLNFEQLITNSEMYANIIAKHFGLSKGFSTGTSLPKVNSAPKDGRMQADLMCSTTMRMGKHFNKSLKELYKILTANQTSNPISTIEPKFLPFSETKCVSGM